MTDPNALAAKAAEHAYSAGNLVTCDGYYEFDLDAAAAVIAADRAGWWRGLRSWRGRCSTQQQ